MPELTKEDVRRHDGLDIVYNLIANDERIRSLATSKKDGLKVRYFEYPSTADMSGNWIVLDSLVNELPSNYADDTWVTHDYLIHIDVWSKNREENRLVSTLIRDLLWKELNFSQNDDNDGYETGIYFDSRRYKGTLHKSWLDER